MQILNYITYMKSTLNNSQQLRNQIGSLVQARQSLDKNTDISGNMVKITQGLKNIKPLMVRQTQFIKNFLQGSETNDVVSKQSETRRYLGRICDINLNEMNELLTSAQKYFTLDIRTSWAKLRNQYEKALVAEREQNQKANLIEFLFKILNLRDKIFKQFIKSIVYRKCLLWKDLNIVNTGFVHYEKKNITKSIEDYIMHKKYALTKPMFSLPSFQISGQWSLNRQQNSDSSLSQFFKLLNEETEQVFGIVKNYSGLTQQQRNNSDIKRNQEHVKSLRQQIEQANINYQLLERKYRELINKDQKMDIAQLKQKLRIAEEQLQSKDQQLRKLRYEYRDYTRDMNAQRDKIKQLQADLQKINAVEMKKLKEVEMLQNTLMQELNRLDKNMHNFGTMFQFQSDGKKNLAQEIIHLKEKIQKMATILGRHKNQIFKLREEIKRLNLIIIELGIQLKDVNSNKGSNR